MTGSKDCFEIVGESGEEEDLTGAERSHACDLEKPRKTRMFLPRSEAGPCQFARFSLRLIGSERETGRVPGGSKIPSCRRSSEMRL